MQNYIDRDRFCVEAHAINMAAKSGEIFANLGAKQKGEFEASQFGAQKHTELKPLPKGMPRRLPGQHLKGLRPGEQAICAQCGNVAECGVWGQERTEFEGMFFCIVCWSSADAVADEGTSHRKKGSKAKRKPKPRDVFVPTTLHERASVVH